MYCRKCGHEVKDNDRFCPNCGEKMSAVQDWKEAAEEMANSAEQSLGSAINEMKDSFNGRDNVGDSNRPGAGGVVNMPERLTEDRSLLIYFLLSLITCGIYSFYFVYKMAHDTNVACAGDDENTSGLVVYILLSLITCGFYSYYWQYKIGNRLAANAPKYGLHFQENGTTILMWDLFGMLLCCLGPWIAMHILIKNSNAICRAYNRSMGF